MPILRILLAVLLLVMVAACTGTAVGPSAATPEPTQTATDEPTEAPTEEPTPVPLDPECEAAFVAGMEAREAEPDTYLDPALFACGTLDNFRAASRAYPDAIDIHVDAFLATRCLGKEENLQAPVCIEANPHD